MSKQLRVLVILVASYFLLTSLPISNPVPVTIKKPVSDIQVEIPESMRVFNKTGSQCVFCVAETLGNLHGCKGTKGLTDKYKGITGPREFTSICEERHINMKYTTNRDLDFIEKWVTNEQMGVGIGIFHTHCITLCHFERNKCVKIIDNSDPELSVQTWQWDKFKRNFDVWSFVILPDKNPLLANFWLRGRKIGIDFCLPMCYNDN